jgi:hypothetical protein
LRSSAISGKIHINRNWSATKTAGICTGSETVSDPYLISDLIVNCKGEGKGIFIENFSSYFKSENCTIYNSESTHDIIYAGGIQIENVING